MSMRRLSWKMLGAAVLYALVTVPASAQVSEQTAREHATNTVRSELHSKVHFKADQFLGIHRDEELEQSLAIATVGWHAGPEFIYRVSPTGIEIREDAIVNHVATDADFMYIVAVNSLDGSTYRIHGFGLAESLAGFERLMTASKMRASSPDQAESLADFYRAVNPENYEALTPVSSLIELKQAAERQCQRSSFDKGEKAFDTWWKRAKPLYEGASFRQSAVPHGAVYLVEWIVLSSAGSGSCGGSPLRAQREVETNGQVGKLRFIPLRQK